MKKYLVIYHTPAEALSAMANATPEEMEAGMKPWMDWSARCGEQLVELGSPLTGGTRISRDGNQTPSKKEVTGYSILQAADMESAKALLDGHPHLSWHDDATIEIHEAVAM